MKFVFASLLVLSSVSAFATDCAYTALGAGEVTTSTVRGNKFQTVRFNKDLFNPHCALTTGTRGQLYFSRSDEGLCHVNSLFHLRTSGHAKVWVRVNGREETLEMDRLYTYGTEHRASFACPAKGELDVQFAFDLGQGNWDNNAGHDYRVLVPDFK